MCNLCVVDFIENLPGVFEDMVRNKSSLQNNLNELMKTRRTDAYVTRIWSTCSSMIKINGTKKEVEDNHFIVDDAPQSHSLRSLLQCVQDSSKQIMKVRLEDKKYVNDYFGELYAYFLIQGHTHTTHYVSMAEEFPSDKDFKTSIARVSSRCKKSVKDTKIIVLVNVDSTKKDATAPVTFASEQTATTSAQNSRSREILKSLLESLLMIDGVNTVVLLTDNPDESMSLPTLFEEVIQIVKEVSMPLSV